MRRFLSTAAAALALLASGAAGAAEHQVRMLNKSAEGAMAFDPPVLRIAPGDAVRFVASDKGHNAESIAGMAPAGAEPFQGKMNQDVTVTFERPGVYGYQCKPHYAMGMVGLVVVGDAAVNLEEAKAVQQKGRARQRFEAAFAVVEGKRLAAN